MDQTTKEKGGGGMWTKLVLIVLAGLIGYFVGRGNVANPAPDVTANTEDTILGEDDAMAKEDELGDILTGSGETMTPKTTVLPVVSPSTSGVMTETNTIVVNDQPAGSIVTVASMTLATNAWVAIHDSRDGAPGNILGAKRFLAGEMLGVVSVLRATEAGKSYFAMLHTDDGDLEFEFKTGDAPLLGKNGMPVMVAFDALP